jgi:hypothetical protein
MGKRVNWFADHAVALPPLILLVAVVADIFIGTSHPMGAIAGGAAGFAFDTLLWLPALLIGLIARPDWRALAAAIVLGAVVEAATMNNEMRALMGREGFTVHGWLLRSLAASAIIAVVAEVKMLMIRRRS